MGPYYFCYFQKQLTYLKKPVGFFNPSLNIKTNLFPEQLVIAIDTVNMIPPPPPFSV